MRERQMALEIARDRELFYWYGAFYLTSVAFCSMRWEDED